MSSSRLTSFLAATTLTASTFACGSEPPPVSEGIAPLEVDAIPHGHTFEGMTTVQLTSSRPAAIYYTLGGEDPIGPEAIKYDAPIELTKSTLVTFVAGSPDGIWTPPRTELYVPKEEESEGPSLLARALIIDRNNHFFAADSGQTEEMTTTFRVRSIGVMAVHISNIYIDVNPKGWGFYEEGVFHIAGPALENFDLPSGHELEITVGYTPTSTVRSAALIIESDEQRSSDGYLVTELWGRILSW